MKSSLFLPSTQALTQGDLICTRNIFSSPPSKSKHGLGLRQDDLLPSWRHHYSHMLSSSQGSGFHHIIVEIQIVPIFRETQQKPYNADPRFPGCLLRDVSPRTDSLAELVPVSPNLRGAARRSLLREQGWSKVKETGRAHISNCEHLKRHRPFPEVHEYVYLAHGDQGQPAICFLSLCIASLHCLL